MSNKRDDINKFQADLSADELQDMQALFARAKATSFSAPPFIHTRILARVEESYLMKRKLFFWRLWTSLSVACLALVIGVGLKFVNHPDGSVNEVYVIHVDFDQRDQELVARAEVILPDDVHFASNNPSIRQQRKLKLPIQVDSAGRTKLPFVVSADSSGEKQLVVRLLTDKDELVKEQVLKFRFAKNHSRGMSL